MSAHLTPDRLDIRRAIDVENRPARPCKRQVSFLDPPVKPSPPFPKRSLLPPAGMLCPFSHFARPVSTGRSNRTSCRRPGRRGKTFSRRMNPMSVRVRNPGTPRSRPAIAENPPSRLRVGEWSPARAGQRGRKQQQFRLGADGQGSAIEHLPILLPSGVPSSAILDR